MFLYGSFKSFLNNVSHSRSDNSIMKKITFPLEPSMQSIEVENQQLSPEGFIDHIMILIDNEGARIDMFTALKKEYFREE